MLKIETFNNRSGGNAFFKAVTHPLAARAVPQLLAGLVPPVAVYDPLGVADALAELYDLSSLPLAGAYVQDASAVGRTLLGRAARPVTALGGSGARSVLVTAFEAERAIDHVCHLLPAGAAVASLDALRLPPALVTRPKRYLDPLNFATNFVFFRDEDGLHTRLVTVNYWRGYGAGDIKLWLVLFDGAGEVLAEWTEDAPASLGTIAIDSRAVRARFGLGDFTGQLFLHVVGAEGHDVVKYALDVFGANPAERALSCTHDANAWPADFYAGLPAPADGERVILWVQNSQPCPIPAGSIALNHMGRNEIRTLDRPLAPFATTALDTAELWPDARWPDQLEIRAGKYIVRPRYEVVAKGRRRIAHVNVERTDLAPDPRLPELAPILGKGYLLPAPILPLARWRSTVLPTPMATDQRELPIALALYDASGAEVARHRFGPLPRHRSVAVEIDALLAGSTLASGTGHMELLYDFAEGGEGDGWLHAIFRYADRVSEHAAETSFGAHVFNTVVTYRDEPQSYAGRPPGLSTRLFLRLGPAPLDTLCHLIYPASTPWHARSSTALVLHDRAGTEVAREAIEIPCSGSRFWRYTEVFDAHARATAGDNAYIVIRDTTCRLFGYHGLMDGDGAFSLDHMFGF